LRSTVGEQLDAGSFEFRLLRVVEPPAVRVVERVATVRDLSPLHLEPVGPLPTLPCGEVTGAAELRSGGRTLDQIFTEHTAHDIADDDATRSGAAGGSEAGVAP